VRTATATVWRRGCASARQTAQVASDPPFNPIAPFVSFDEVYRGTPPWEIGRPQPALLELFESGQVSGRVLDVGCGTGELALTAAARGLQATGVDSSAEAIAIARQRAVDRGLAGARFEVADAMDLSVLDTIFDTVMDSGVFHLFDDADRARYVESVRRVTAIGGLYHMLVFSDEAPGHWGPRRIRRIDIETALADGWDLRSVEPAIFEVNIVDGRVRAWRATAVRSG
jgi:SAM-dependent methyltransferase